VVEGPGTAPLLGLLKAARRGGRSGASRLADLRALMLRFAPDSRGCSPQLSQGLITLCAAGGATRLAAARCLGTLASLGGESTSHTHPHMHTHTDREERFLTDCAVEGDVVGKTGDAR
jgi:hypothetical protein